MFAAAEEIGPVDRALWRMKEHQRPGIVLVVPADKTRATELAEALSVPLQQGAPGIERLLCEAVYACVPEAEVAARFPERKADARLLLLDADGRLVEGCACAPADLRERFEATVGGLLDGADGARLRARAEGEHKALGAEEAKRLDDAVAALGSAEFDEREAASKTIQAMAQRAMASLALADTKATDPEARARLQAMFDHLCASGLVETPSPRLPYGTRWNTHIVFYGSIPGPERTEELSTLEFVGE